MSLGFGLKQTIDFRGLDGNELLNDDTNAENMVYSRVKLSESESVGGEMRKTREAPRRRNAPWWKVLDLRPPPSSNSTEPIPSIVSVSVQRADCTRMGTGLSPLAHQQKKNDGRADEKCLVWKEK